MTDFDKLFDTENFKTAEELQGFLDNLVSDDVPHLTEETLAIQEEAKALVMEAYALDAEAGKNKVLEAFNTDPHCIEIYVYLGLKEPRAAFAKAYFKKGIAIGRKLFGGQFRKEYIGMFWGIVQTQSYMRCLQFYSECLYTLGEIEESVKTIQEMLELNPVDTQNMRDPLLLHLIELNDTAKFRKYAMLYEEDVSAFSLYTRALFAFKTEDPDADKLLEKAYAKNDFIPTLLLSDEKIILPDYHGFGDEQEADYYAFFARHIWVNTEGALEWLRNRTGLIL